MSDLLHNLLRTAGVFAAVISGVGLAGQPAKAAQINSVVELFTSQGCSSCPPADKLMGEIARVPDRLVLSFPVDYWDYIGWKDTFGSPACTARQKAYAATRGDGAVYTPQVVVDGLAHVVGSDADAVSAAEAANRGKAGALSVNVQVSENGQTVHAAVAAGAGKGIVWLVNISRSREVAIGRGENAGRTVTYTNIVRSMTQLGDWTGAAVSFDIPLGEIRKADADGYAVLVQAGTMARPTAILGAAKSSGI